jgi:hypothetical protein
MIKCGFFVGLILIGLTCNAQSRYDRLIGRVNLAEDYFEAKASFEELEQISCMVDYYPLMAAKAMNENQRLEGVGFIDKALRSGYALQDFETNYISAYKTLSEVTKDSLTNYLELSNSLSFNWRKRQLLQSIFTAELVNEARLDCDTSQRILASSLRNLLNQYMRIEGLPSDCEVGYGMKAKSIRLIYNKSHLLFETEWNQLQTIILKAAERYQISYSQYASIVDAYYWITSETNKYGSNRFGTDEVQKAYIREHLEEINENRKSIGLSKINAVN